MEQKYKDVFDEIASLGVIGDVLKYDYSVSDPDRPAPEPLPEEVKKSDLKLVASEEVEEPNKSAPTPNHEKMVELCDQALKSLGGLESAVGDLRKVFLELKKGWVQDIAADKDE